MNVDLIALFYLVFQLVSEQQESRPLLSPSIDDFLCETKCDGTARPVTSNTAGTRDTDRPFFPQIFCLSTIMNFSTLSTALAMFHLNANVCSSSINKKLILCNIQFIQFLFCFTKKQIVQNKSTDAGFPERLWFLVSEWISFNQIILIDAVIKYSVCYNVEHFIYCIGEQLKQIKYNR